MDRALGRSCGSEESLLRSFSAIHIGGFSSFRDGPGSDGRRLGAGHEGQCNCSNEERWRRSCGSDESLLRSFSSIHTDGISSFRDGHGSDGRRLGGRREASPPPPEPTRVQLPQDLPLPPFSRCQRRQYTPLVRPERDTISRAASVAAPSSPAEENQNDMVGGAAEHKGFRHDYSIGDSARSLSHIAVHPTRAIVSLKKHDFAFVKRSDGSYSYAILAYRCTERVKGKEEECMVFVMSERGSTKVVRQKYWGRFVRLVSPEGTGRSKEAGPSPRSPKSHPSLDRMQLRGGEGLGPPGDVDDRASPPSLKEVLGAGSGKLRPRRRRGMGRAL